MSLKSIFKQVISKGMIKKAISIARYEGLGSLLTKVRSKCRGGREFSDAIDRNKDAKSPLVSIIIPVYNASKYTAECLESLYSVKNTTDFEVILIDNGSTDDTPDLIIEQSRLKDALYYFSQEKNLGFSGGVNLGIRHSKGKYIVILNNDTRVSNHWLDRLVAHAEQNPDVGIFSAITNYIGEGPQMAEDAKALGIDQINDYAASIAGRNLEIEPTRLVFFCVLIRRTLLDMIGLLDEDYIKGNFEDDDYCLRALLSGYKLAIAKDSFVYHHGSVTFHKNRIPHTSYMEENRKRFFEKVQRLSTASRSTRRLTSTPTTSLILRTLNRPALLSRALASLGNQTIKNFEVVVVNDGGEDVKNILDRYQQDFLIDYVHNQKSLGRTAALNVGIERAKGDWIGFLDDDDILYPWHFAVFAKELASKRDKLFFYSNYNRSLFSQVGDDSPFLSTAVNPWNYSKKELWISNRIPIHTWLVRKACFNQTGLFDETQQMLEDFEFLVRLSEITDFTHINVVTCEYRYYLDGSNSMMFQREKVFEALNVIYQKHPSRDKYIQDKRNTELEVVKKEVERIATLRKTLSGDFQKDEAILTKMISIILGFQ